MVAEWGDEFVCRICFDEAKPSALISPCRCKGTLRYVHPACLRRWQASVLKLGQQERAYTCGVCCSRYTTSPPRTNLWRGVMWSLRALLGAVCIFAVAFGLTGPPLLHVALLALLLLGTRSQALAFGLLLLLGGGVGALYARGLRIVVRTDQMGRLGVALIRYGPPVDALQPGSLLVAAPGLRDPMFERAVVLVTETGRKGAKGVLLTRPIPDATEDLGLATTVRSSGASHTPGSKQPATGPRITHFLGGPVGAASGVPSVSALRSSTSHSSSVATGGVGVGGGAASDGGGGGGPPPRRRRKQAEVLVLHHISGLPGAVELITPALAPSPPPPAPGADEAATVEAAAAALAGDASSAPAADAACTDTGADSEGDSSSGSSAQQLRRRRRRTGNGGGDGGVLAAADRPRWVAVVRSKAAAAAAAVVAAACGRRRHSRAAGGAGTAGTAVSSSAGDEIPSNSGEGDLIIIPQIADADANDSRTLLVIQRRLQQASASDADTAAGWETAAAAAAAVTAADPAPPPRRERRVHTRASFEAAERERARAAAAAAAAAASDGPVAWEEDAFGIGLFLGGPLDELMRRLQQAAAASAAHPQHAAAGPPAARQVVRVFHGTCSWSAGQLEGEIRDGVWGLVPQARVWDVAGTAPEALWHELTEGDRPRWM